MMRTLDWMLLGCGIVGIVGAVAWRLLAIGPALDEREWEQVIHHVLATGCCGHMAVLEAWPESHRPGFALRQADVLQSYTA